MNIFIHSKTQIQIICLILLVCSMCLYIVLHSQTNDYAETETGPSWLDFDITILNTEEIQKLNQRDPKLQKYLMARHLTPPSKLPYNFDGKLTKSPGEDGGITKAIRDIFKNATGGFFVECGGYDGIYSNTLFLEREFQWTGLLIECNPVLIPELIKTHRKAFVADVCISLTENPEPINITSIDYWPASSSVGTGDIFPKHFPPNFTRFEVQSFPIYSIIVATGVKVVDFITLDVQSIEWKVVKNFPFDLLLVKVWVIEIEFLSTEDTNEMNSFMTSKGYRKSERIGTADLLFVHNSVN